MKALIIEDEELAAKRLISLLKKVNTDIEIQGVCESIVSSVKWLMQNEKPDLIFMDIQLSDGLSFEIFKKIEIDSSIIFTTAFDEYAIQAFKLNSIDYLLKPFNEEELEAAIAKFEKLYGRKEPLLNEKEIEAILNGLVKNQPVYKSRFLVKTGQTFVKISSDEIAYFFVDNKITYLVLKNGKKHITDHVLDDLERELNPYNFFRVNRQYILNADSIEDVHTFFSGKLKVHVIPKSPDEIIISRVKAAAFKEWLNR